QHDTTSAAGAGFILMQRHSVFSFYYQTSGNGNQNQNFAFTPTFLGATWDYLDTTPNGTPPTGDPDRRERELNPSQVVVCAGMDNTDPNNKVLRVRANTGTFATKAFCNDPYNNNQNCGAQDSPLPSGQTYVPANGQASSSQLLATIGNLETNTVDNAYHGRIYETAIWAEPATEANIQNKMARVQALTLTDGSVAQQYERPSEGPYLGPDNVYYTAAHEGPRIDPTLGALFGLQGWNRIADPESLTFWTAAGNATVSGNATNPLISGLFLPPNDSEFKSADRVTLPPNASLTAGLMSQDGFDTGTVQGQIWIRPESPSGGSLEIALSATGQPVATAQFTTLNQWTRIPFHGTDANPTIVLKNAGSSTLTFEAWGATLTQIGEAGNNDPGFGMYTWTPFDDRAYQPLADWNDMLTFPPFPFTTASTGFCLSANGDQPLGWNAVATKRVPVAWGNGKQSALIALDPTNGLCFTVTNGTSGSACAKVASLTLSGGLNAVKGCETSSGKLNLYVGNTSVATGQGPTAPDLQGGNVTVGSAVDGTNFLKWHGHIKSASACASSDPTTCN
ncbi:MAG TPA: hypothetical protein VMK12_08820, partial [Anaeromyxobacteraceae bacterium]|nr:hypothetical protein [Anaeromyxobacteraceae bacterium]